MTRFRPDIEGLRAVAVGLVLLFHAAPDVFSGGFVGVDVFFVISGYLITLSLLDGHAPAQALGMNLARFWARRVRRLLPNALLVLVTVTLIGLWTLDDAALGRLGSDVAWSAGYGINWLFVLRSVDYLRWSENEASVLLNYWSLAVEEQFYLVWPLLLLLVWRGAAEAGRARSVALGVAVAAALASFGHMLLLGADALTTAFFASSARAWELMTGAVLALGLRGGAGRSVPAGVPLAWVGMAAIVAAAASFSSMTAHPGGLTLVPVLGAAAVVGGLHGAPQALLARLLGSSAMRAIGARSYSIYLWHWPVLQLGAAWWPHHGVAVRLALLLGAVAVAELAYRFVETPLRRTWRLQAPPRAVLLCGLGASALVVAAGITVVRIAEGSLRADALPGAPRGASGLPPLRDVRRDLPAAYADGCHLGVEPDAPPPGCRYGAAGAPVVLLFGDSHAAQWMPALEAVTRARGLALVVWTKSSCPSADVTIWNTAARGPYRECDRWREAAMAQLRTLSPVLIVVSNLVDDATQIVDRRDGSRLEGAPAAAAFDAGLLRQLERLRASGVPTVLLRDNPRPRPDVLGCLYAQPDPSRCARPTREALLPESRDVAVARAAGVPVWDLGAAICAAATCPVLVTAGVPPRPQVVYRDDNHLTASFVAGLAGALDAVWPREAARTPGDNPGVMNPRRAVDSVPQRRPPDAPAANVPVGGR